MFKDTLIHMAEFLVQVHSAAASQALETGNILISLHCVCI